jgi:hypothetical protein
LFYGQTWPANGHFKFISHHQAVLASLVKYPG